MHKTAEIKIKLKDLLHGIERIDESFDCLITGIAIDSSKVQPGDLFLAYRGEIADGRDFIIGAVNKGAVAVLCEDFVPKNLSVSVPIVIIAKLRELIGLIAAKFYDFPSRKLTVIGVTGTSGKTSVTQFIAAALSDLGIVCGVIGTIGAGFPGKLSPLINTTPDPVTLQHWLYEFKKAGAQVVAMEVSSHSLVQKRVSGIEFKLAVFTNLTREHLDYHGTMEDYGAAKKMLFMQPGLQYAIINADDSFGKNFIKELQSATKVYAYTIKDTETEVESIKAKEIKLSSDGIAANIISPWGKGQLRSHFLGDFNLSNLIAVLAVLGAMKVDLSSALVSIEKLKTVNGRMQVFGGGKKPLVVVDYAHKPDALEKVLLVLRKHCSGVLWCVFGCGGDRDRGKRPIMGQIAQRYSDYVIITNDNPRTEDPQEIIDDILKGLICPLAAKIEQDRKAAISLAISCANANDIVLIAGKGHEDYQIIGKEKVHFSDIEEVEKILEAKF